MVAELSAFLGGLKAASDVIKGLSSMKVDAAVNEKVIELSSIIISLQAETLSLQTEYSKLVQTKSELEKVITKMNEWNITKEKYILREIAPDVFAYSHKEEKDSAGNKHWLCANCMDNEKKESIYQVSIKGNLPNHTYYCPSCKNEILVKNPDYKVVMPQIVRRENPRF